MPGEVVGRDSSRGQLSPKFDAGLTGCKVVAATYSDGWVASRLQAARVRHLDTFVRTTCALRWRQSLREISGCSGRRAIDLPSSGRPSRAPGVCTGSSGSLRVHALPIRPGPTARHQRAQLPVGCGGERTNESHADTQVTPSTGVINSQITCAGSLTQIAARGGIV